MKKTVVMIIAVLCAVLMVVSLCACSKNETKSTPQETVTATAGSVEKAAEDVAKAAEKAANETLDNLEKKNADDGAVDTASEATNGNDPGIVGVWSYADVSSVEYKFEFLEDGTGTYDAAGQTMKFTYTTENGKVSILYEGNTAPFVSEYTIKDNVLTITDSLGNPVNYNKT